MGQTLPLPHQLQSPGDIYVDQRFEFWIGSSQFGRSDAPAAARHGELMGSALTRRQQFGQRPSRLRAGGCILMHPTRRVAYVAV